ncbi:hypothetical protein FSARC_14065 [Fusarium sarcochroum]|uniref:Uncharacterized protein n=1 Tax=Fusarium sarcochroum TaxID=1208366 RepID=A0A8H4WRC3_9HYPO|nr:hypothetical protein FSARC_14065 [Fusarium sarcochroum]
MHSNSDLVANSTPDDPPPPYSDDPHPASSTEPLPTPSSFPASLTPKPLVTECASLPYVPLPQALTAYYQLSYRTFHLGSDSNHKIFAASVYAGNTGKGPDRFSIVVHNGPSGKDQVLAAAGEMYKSTGSAISFRNIINLSPVPGQDNVLVTGDATVAMEHMSAKLMEDGRTVIFPFSILTTYNSGADAKGKKEDFSRNLHHEHFEWRMTTKEEIADKSFAHEYKLFRLPPQQAAGGSAAAGEPVAMASFKRLLNLSKPFKMQFLDPETTHSSSERWRLMALITALRIWQHEQTSFYSSNAMVDIAGKGF